MRTDEVFGIKPEVRFASYVDRRSLDATFKMLIDRKQKHIAIRGASKCGKSWLRQKIIIDPILVQCRLNKKASDIYVDALSELGVNLEIESTKSFSIKGKVSAKGHIGAKLLASVGLESSYESSESQANKEQKIGHDITDLSFIAKIIKSSGRTLVIEDFHYLSVDERAAFAFDLKALWDYQVFTVVIGVWTQDNMLLSLNPDLSGRMEELSVAWSPFELQEILKIGGEKLNLEFSRQFQNYASEISFGSAGILQSLALGVLDEIKIYESSPDIIEQIDSTGAIEAAAMHYAEQLNPLYQEFAKVVSNGIRARQNSTGIYAHAISVILKSSDEELTKGLSAQEIFKRANNIQPRVQLSNLKTVLQKFEELQVDAQGRGLILAYNPSTERITVVDRQLLLYRRFLTVSWPWEQIVAESDANIHQGFDELAA